MAGRWPYAAARCAVVGIIFVFLQGCYVKTLVDGDKAGATLFSPDILKVTVPTDPPKPAVKENSPPLQPDPPKPVTPAVDEKLLPQELTEPDVALVRPLSAANLKTAAFLQSKSRFPSDPQVVFSDQVLTEDVSWQGEVLIVGSLTVAPQATVTVAPGTRIRFRVSASGESVLVVLGRLVATGSADKPVVFTGDGENGSRRDWQGIVFIGTMKKNTLENVIIEGAETGVDASYSTVAAKNVRLTGCLTGLAAFESVVTVAGGEASGCENGMLLTYGEVDINGMKLTGNGVAVRAEKSSLFISSADFSGNRDIALAGIGCAVKISGSAFTANGRGAILDDTKGDINGNLFQGNRGTALQLAGSRIRATGNEFRENGEYGVRVQEGSPVFWGNIFAANAKYDFYNAGRSDVKAMTNWWDRSDPRSAIFDNRIDAGRGRVLFTPVLRKKPISPLAAY